MACLGYAGTVFAQETYSSGDYLVDIFSDGRSTGVLADFRIDDAGRAFVPAQYLNEAGFAVSENGEVEIGPGFTIDYRFDENDQRLDLYKMEADPDLGRYNPSPLPELSYNIPAIIMDYGLSYQRVSANKATQDSFFGNADIIATRNKWIFDQRFVVNATQGQTNIIRLQTLFERDFLNKITRLSLGDNFYQAPSWGRRSTFAGIQYGRDFSQRPEDNQRPFTQLQTLLKEESEIEVSVNGVTQGIRTVNPGIELISPDQVDGVNLIEIRIRDALGVERVENLSFFSTRDALAKGVHDYSISVGVPRTFNGLENEYEDYLIGAATSRYGINNWLTVETGAELSEKVNTIGAGGLFTVSSIGAFSASFSASQSGDNGFGTQFRGGFERRSSKGSLLAQARIATSSYSDLASEKGIELPDTQWFIRASRRTKVGNLRLTYNERKDTILPRRRFLNAGWDYDIKNGPSLFANGFRDFERDGYGFNIGVRFTRGRYFGRTSYESASGLQRTTLSAGRSRAKRNDWQWSALASDGDGPGLIRADASYQFEHGEYYISGGKTGLTSDIAIGTRGSIVAAGKSVRLKQQIGDAFALVKTPGLSGVTIFKDYRPVGKTNDAGEVLVADLRPFQTNVISISPDEISLDYAVGSTEIEVVPARLGVVEAKFDIESDTSLSFQVLDESGSPIELGLTVKLKNAGTRSVVGYNGRAFLNAANDDDIVQIFGKSLLAEVSVEELRKDLKIIVKLEKAP